MMGTGMPRSRFETARDLFGAFPLMRQELLTEPTDAPCPEFVRTLTDRGELNQAVGVCAYLLPRREAVWWACRAVRAMVPNRDSDENHCLTAAEHWVKSPEEANRLSALEAGLQSSDKSPSAWLARAAGFAGGMMPFGDGISVPIAVEQTARAVRAAIMTAAARVEPDIYADMLKVSIDDAIRLVSHETQEA
jgi:hypothetical protein